LKRKRAPGSFFAAGNHDGTTKSSIAFPNGRAIYVLDATVVTEQPDGTTKTKVPAPPPNIDVMGLVNDLRKLRKKSGRRRGRIYQSPDAT